MVRGIVCCDCRPERLVEGPIMKHLQEYHPIKFKDVEKIQDAAYQKAQKIIYGR